MINCGLLLTVSTTSFADFYKYKDSNGVLRFTDNLSEVPESQRPKADIYKEYKSKQPDPQVALEKAIEAAEKQSMQNMANSQPKESQIQLLGNKILKIQDDLQKEYQLLVAKKKSLEALDQKAGPKKSEKIKHLDEQAKQLNKEIQAYNKKKETCMKAIQKYQQQIKMLSAKGSE
jgi:chromosome segregation ATPase